MMKNYTLTLLSIFIGLSILGVSWYTFAMHYPESAQTFPATVSRDCAPWDGSAFTVRIPWNKGDVLDISIWQAPEIKYSVTFSFPDNTGQIGNASYQFVSGEYQPLSGTVFLGRVDRESPVEGRFELVTDQGQHFEGQFKAEWEDLMMLCG